MEVGHPKPQPKKSCWLVQNSQHPHICFYLHLDSKFSRKLSTCHWVCWCRFVFSSIQSPPPPLPQRVRHCCPPRAWALAATLSSWPPPVRAPTVPSSLACATAGSLRRTLRWEDEDANKRGPLVSERGRELSERGVDDMWVLFVSEREREQTLIFLRSYSCSTKTVFSFFRSPEPTGAFPYFTAHRSFFHGHSSNTP